MAVEEETGTKLNERMAVRPRHQQKVDNADSSINEMLIAKFLSSMEEFIKVVQGLSDSLGRLKEAVENCQLLATETEDEDAIETEEAEESDTPIEDSPHPLPSLEEQYSFNYKIPYAVCHHNFGSNNSNTSDDFEC